VNTWKINPGPAGCVRLVVTHSCGHTHTYTWGGEKFAQAAAPDYAANQCCSCASGYRIESLHDAGWRNTFAPFP
jgi:hypothetical protein